MANVNGYLWTNNTNGESIDIKYYWCKKLKRYRFEMQSTIHSYLCGYSGNKTI